MAEQHRVPYCLEVARNRRFCKGADDAHARIIELEGKLSSSVEAWNRAQEINAELRANLATAHADVQRLASTVFEQGSRLADAEAKLDKLRRHCREDMPISRTNDWNDGYTTALERVLEVIGEEALK